MLLILAAFFIKITQKRAIQLINCFFSCKTEKSVIYLLPCSMNCHFEGRMTEKFVSCLLISPRLLVEMTTKFENQYDEKTNKKRRRVDENPLETGKSVCKRHC
jgi:hypothetical protein